MFVMRLILMVFIRLVARAEQGPVVANPESAGTLPVKTSRQKNFVLPGTLLP